MPRQDTVDFLTAFAIGTALGIGATLLLKPERPASRERIAKQLKPYRKRMERSYGHVRQGVREGADATSEFTGEVISTGRELMSEFRDEVAKIVSDAREELQEMVEERVRSAGRGVRKAGRKLGM